MASDYGHSGASRRVDPATTVDVAGTVDSRLGGPVSGEQKHVAEAGRAIAQGTKSWASPTGTATRTAFDTATVTTAQLAERVKALLDDLIANNLLSK